jgi:hypothetical protein
MKEFEGTTSFRSLHCVLHQQALCAKSLKMNHVMDSYKNCKFYSCKCP